MTGHYLDRLTCLLSASTSRRRALSTLGALAAARLQPARAAQIQLPACGAEGSVCTQIKGCCSGLVCATSYMNPAYGVCVTGEGGMLPVSDSIVVPSSDGIEVELAQEVADAAAAASTAESTLATEETERQARIDAKRAKKDTRRATRRSTNDTQQTTKDTRRDTRRLNTAPQISLEFFQEVPPEAVDPLDEEPPDPGDTPPATVEAEPGQPEIVRVRNQDDIAVVISRIESLQQPDLFSTRQVTIPAGGTQLWLSGQYAADAQRSISGSTVWTKETVCPDGGGVELTAAQSGSELTHRLSVLCGQTASFVGDATGNDQNHQNNKDHQRKQRARRLDAKKKRQDRRHATRGKGK